MRYRTLGRTGIKVSPYALGAMMFGAAVGNPDHDDSIRIIHKALDAGINIIDPADAYGDSEVVVGTAIKDRRASIALATKVGRPVGEDPNHTGSSRRWIMTPDLTSICFLFYGITMVFFGNRRCGFMAISFVFR